MPDSASRPPISHRMRTQARRLRRDLTPAEAALWRVLRDRRLSSTKWRRQAPIGIYIVDFVCFEHRVVVECDGSQHADSASDAVRDAWLVSQGFRVARFWNNQVLHERDAVLESLLALCGLPF